MFVDGIVFFALYASWCVLTTSVVSAYRLVRWATIKKQHVQTTPEQLTIETLQFRVAELEREAHYASKAHYTSTSRASASASTSVCRADDYVLDVDNYNYNHNHNHNYSGAIGGGGDCRVATSMASLT